MNWFDLYVDALAGVIVLGIAFIFFYYLWQQYVIDVTRHQLFELRDQLFDMATVGRLKRDNIAYRLMREMLNSALRFTHKTGYLPIMTVAILGKPEIRSNASRVYEVIGSIEDVVIRAEVLRLLKRMVIFLLLGVVKRSFLLLLLLPVLGLLYVIIMLSMQFFDDFVLRIFRWVPALIYDDAARRNPKYA